jgi:hypothetical protein
MKKARFIKLFKVSERGARERAAAYSCAGRRRIIGLVWLPRTPFVVRVPFFRDSHATPCTSRRPYARSAVHLPETGLLDSTDLRHTVVAPTISGSSISARPSTRFARRCRRDP